MRKFNREILLLINATIFSITFYMLAKTFLPFIEKLSPYFLTIIAIVVGMISAFITYRFLEFSLPKSYRVAIVGFPASGKTTLIVTLFREIFARRIKGVKAILRGKSTIEKINLYLAKLDRGIALGPTKDQDIFAFRSDVTTGNFPFSRTYKMEFGDFPGDVSEKYASEFGIWLHNAEYFKWVIDADAIIFVIDLAKYLSYGTKYVALISKAIRAAWQHYLESNLQRLKPREIRQKNILIIFTKSDVFRIKKAPEFMTDASLLQINKTGFGKKIPKFKTMNYGDYKKGATRCRSHFDDLIRYLKNETNNFSTLFTSSFAFFEGKENLKIGINEILKKILE